MMKTEYANALLEEFILALCVYREARGESIKGKLLVAETIVNRARDPKNRWPKTIVGVVTQPLQFSSFNKSDPNVAVYPKPDEQAWAACVVAAKEALESNPTDRLTTANHYHTRAVNPKWADATKIVEVEGAHIFYNL